MLSVLGKLLLTSTAMAPVLLTYAWVTFQAGQHRLAGILFGTAFLLVVLCLSLIRYVSHNFEQMKFVSSSIEAADRENGAFLLLYLMPLLTSSVDGFNWAIWLPAIVVFGLVVATGYSYHFNPLLGLFGWHFYRVGTPEGVTYVMVTRKHLRKAAQSIKVCQLTEYIVIDVEDV